MTTRSTAEALSVLKATRRELIQTAREIAIEQIRRDGETTSRKVLAEIEARGQRPEGISDHWLGAVFQGTPFQWTGRQEPYYDTKRNIHPGRSVKVWTL